MVVVKCTTKWPFGSLLSHNFVLFGCEFLFPIRFGLIFHVVHNDFLSIKKDFECSEIFVSLDEYDTRNRLDRGQNVTFNSRDDRMFVFKVITFLLKRTMRPT